MISQLFNKKKLSKDANPKYTAAFELDSDRGAEPAGHKQTTVGGSDSFVIERKHSTTRDHIRRQGGPQIKNIPIQSSYGGTCPVTGATAENGHGSSSLEMPLSHIRRFSAPAAEVHHGQPTHSLVQSSNNHLHKYGVSGAHAHGHVAAHAAGPARFIKDTDDLFSETSSSVSRKSNWQNAPSEYAFSFMERLETVGDFADRYAQDTDSCKNPQLYHREPFQASNYSALAVLHATMSVNRTPMLAIDVTGNILACNSMSADVFGYSTDVLLQFNLCQLIMDTPLADHLEAYRKEVKREFLQSRHFVLLKHANGRPLPCELTMAELPLSSHAVHAKSSKSGRKASVAGLGGDASSSPQPNLSARAGTLFICHLHSLADESDLAFLYRITRALIDRSIVPIIGIETDGTIGVYNPAAQKTFGYTIEEVSGKNIKMLMPPKIAKMHDVYLQTYLKTGIKNVVDKRRPVPGMHKTGREVPLELKITEAKSRDGRRAFIGFIEEK